MSDEHPDLTALLRGELTNAEAVEAAEHTRTCRRCRVELVDDALGHGLLTRARRTLGVSEAVTEAGTESGTEPTAVPAGAPPGLTELSARSRRTRRARPLLVGVAAVALVAVGAGGALTAAGVTRDAGRTPAPVAEQTATLKPVEGPDEGRATGTVAMGTAHDVTRMQLATRSLPSPPHGEFYYAWLLDPRTKKMLPLGQVTPGHVATFEVPEPLVAAYSAVDVSLEADDGNPEHSVTSVLRAAYADPAKATS